MLNTNVSILNCKRWVRSTKVLVEQSGDTITLYPCAINADEQAAICYVLLDLLSERLGMAPFAVDISEVEHVLDCLSSIAEFPEANPV
jgi:hypothetical protein